MKEILENVFAVEVPDDGIDFEIYGTVHRPGVSYNRPNVYERQAMEIPAGNWETLFTTKDCTEEQIDDIIEKQVHEWGPIAYPDGRIDYSCEGLKVVMRKDYATTKEKGEPHFNSFRAVDCLHSLLRSKNLDPGLNYLIIRKK